MKEILIQDGRGTKAVIIPDKGATVVSLEKDGVEFLYRDQENLDSSERPRCGIPFLFPIFGRLKDGVYTWDGQEYAMAIHGFGHTSPWRVAAQTENELVPRNNICKSNIESAAFCTPYQKKGFKE